MIFARPSFGEAGASEKAERPGNRSISGLLDLFGPARNLDLVHSANENWRALADDFRTFLFMHSGPHSTFQQFTA
jgi:hypothetical protein